ncbi:MAG: hypothetical protein Q8N85_02915 [Candidatus Omnitrophota bacterium]|nr:hypothetical protein [Candidatus Omnitrophota bacterium]
MPEPRAEEKAVALLVVIATILVVMGLASAMLNIMSSHYRLTHHQVSRIQAYYASMAGINYAYECLRTGSFVAGTHCLAASGGCNLSDPAFPASIQPPIKIIITPAQSSDPSQPCYNHACISVTTNYTYTNPS